MRTLKFPKDSIEYRLLHQATLQAEFKPAPAEYALIAEVQERLESIGVTEAERKKDSDIMLYSCPKAASVTFEEEEFRMLKKLFENTGFLPAVARFVKATQILLDNAVEEKPTPSKSSK